MKRGLKSDSYLPVGFINFDGRPLKMMKNAFYFMLKVCFVFFSFFVDKKANFKGLISKFMTPQTGKQIITVHILPNISRSKGNRTTKFGQLIEHNMGDVF